MRNLAEVVVSVIKSFDEQLPINYADLRDVEILLQGDDSKSMKLIDDLINNYNIQTRLSYDQVKDLELLSKK